MGRSTTLTVAAGSRAARRACSRSAQVAAGVAFTGVSSSPPCGLEAGRPRRRQPRGRARLGNPARAGLGLATRRHSLLLHAGKTGSPWPSRGSRSPAPPARALAPAAARARRARATGVVRPLPASRRLLPFTVSRCRGLFVDEASIAPMRCRSSTAGPTRPFGRLVRDAELVCVLLAGLIKLGGARCSR